MIRWIFLAAAALLLLPLAGSIESASIGSMDSGEFVPEEIFTVGEKVYIDLTGFENISLFIIKVVGEDKQRFQAVGLGRPYTQYILRDSGNYTVEIVNQLTSQIIALGNFTVLEEEANPTQASHENS